MSNLGYSRRLEQLLSARNRKVRLGRSDGRVRI